MLPSCCFINEALVLSLHKINNIETLWYKNVPALHEFWYLLQTFRLLHEEGFFVGASTGLNIAAAKQVAELMGPGHTIVTCLCDTGQVSTFTSSSINSNEQWCCCFDI